MINELMTPLDLARPEYLSSSKPILASETMFYTDCAVSLFQGDATYVLSRLASESVDCVVTSPPYYGQRDYGVAEQIGLEVNPQDYISRLLVVFSQVKRILKPGGSLWVNIGDTYWSGKGRPKGPDHKQKHRRFERPQDKTGEKPWRVPKQLLLIPHRFAIAMQDAGWIVRNDQVWHKLSPTPDPVTDRCSRSHEYVFHFVKQKKYYFDAKAVAVSTDQGKTKPPGSVWSIANRNNRKNIRPFFQRPWYHYRFVLLALPMVFY